MEEALRTRRLDLLAVDPPQQREDHLGVFARLHRGALRQGLAALDYTILYYTILYHTTLYYNIL